MLTRPISDRRRFGRTAAAALVAFSLVAAACGGDDDDAVAPATTAAPDGGDDGSDDGDTDDGADDGDDGDAATTTAPAVTPPPASEFEPQYGGRLVMAVEAETANPWLPGVMNCDVSCSTRARTFYDPLVVVDDELNLRPFLLESVEANEDDTVFTLTVRQGITFHDGSELNAEVVADNLQRNLSSLLIAAAVKDLARNEDGTLVIEILDDYTLTMATGFDGNPAEPLPWPTFPFYLAGQGGLIASSEWMAAVDAGNAAETEAVGTGPFILSSYAPGDRLTVVRNDDYWLTDNDGNQLPYLDEIEFRVIPDSQVRGQALRSGDVDIIHTSDSLVVADLSSDPAFGYQSQEALGETNYYMLNLTKPYLQDRDVRCALTQAIDPIDLIDVTGGNATPAPSPFSPGQEGFIEDLERIAYDPDAARAVIEAWEAANGPLEINLSSTPTVTNLTAAQYLAAVWGDVGVDVTIDQIEQSTLINNALFGSPDFDAFGWRNHAGLFVDAQYFWWHSSASAPPGELALNFGRLEDPEVDRLLELARSESDPDVRRGYAEEINLRFVDQCFVIPTSFARWGIHWNERVQNVGRSPIPDTEQFMRDGAGFQGQIWVNAMFVTD